METAAVVFEEWAVLELMGHRRVAGKVTEQQIAGAGFIRIDIPSDPPATQFYAPSSVYAITPTTEEIARAIAKEGDHGPINRWELRRMLEAPAAADDDPF